MRTMLIQWIRNQQGSTILLVAFTIVVLLACVALVVDGGTLYAAKSHLQKTANAAALSGAQELTETEFKVRAVVRTVLEKHGEVQSLAAETIAMGHKVTVELMKEVPLGFARLFGFPSAPVKAKASAEILAMGSAAGAAPVGIDESIELEYYREYQLKVDQTEVSMGNFGLLALGGFGSRTYGDNLKYGYQGVLKIGDIIDTEKGNKVGDTKEGVQYRIDRCPDPESRDCARIILVPVYKPLGDPSKQLKEVEITGFAYFYITKPANDNDKTITGMFIKRAGTGAAEPGAASKGAYAIRLTD